MQGAIDGLMREGDLDIIQVESSQMMCFDFGKGAAVVLDEHNVEYDLLRQVAHLERFSARRLFGYVDAAKARRDEIRAWSSVDGCVATSVGDEAVIRRACPGVCTAVVPNGVDTEQLRPGVTPVDPDSLVFVGSMNYRPNADAVLWFVDHVLPLVRRVRRSVVLTVVGYDPPASLESYAASGVVVAGAVPDVRPFLERAAVVLAPLRAGGGTRLKVLEGLSMGKAVVSTTLGAEGIDVVPGEHLLIADDPEEMAGDILELIHDSALRARIGHAGRALVVEKYGWGTAVARLEAFHADVIAKVQERRH